LFRQLKQASTVMDRQDLNVVTFEPVNDPIVAIKDFPLGNDSSTDAFSTI